MSSIQKFKVRGEAVDEVTCHTLGAFMHSKDNRGCCLDLNSARLFARKWEDFRIVVCSSCSSSLDVAWKMIDNSRLEPGDSVLCLQQTSGRGRMRRKWASPRGNIYGALYLPNPENREADPLLSIIAGYIFLCALRQRGVGVSLKWPNDLVLKGKKVGGVLLEEKNDLLLAGLGLNLKVVPEYSDLRASGILEAGTLNGAWPGADPLESWVELVYWSLFWFNEVFCSFSLIDFIREINACLWLAGERIKVEQEGRVMEGYLQGLNSRGGMILNCSGRLENIHSGSLIP